MIALIALLSSYEHISLPAGAKLQLPQQWGVWFIAASGALVLVDAQLATGSRRRAADGSLNPLPAQRPLEHRPASSLPVGARTIPDLRDLVMTRLELRINQDLASDLEAFTQSSATSKSEIIRRALTLYALARDEQQRGRHLAFVKDGQVEREVVAL